MYLRLLRLAPPAKRATTPPLTPTSSALRSYASLAATKAKEQQSAGWLGTCTDGSETKSYVNGKWETVGKDSLRWYEVKDPSTQKVLTKVPQPNEAFLKKAVDAAEEAFQSWSRTSVLHRQAILLKYQALIKEHWDDLARSIVLEQGKTFADAKGDVLRGLQASYPPSPLVVESMCALPNLLTGEKLEVSTDMDTYVRRSPLGVGAAICPFNFPAMIPLWSLPIAIACGNTLLIKPSERDPGAATMLVQLAEKAGVPPGVVSVIHGGPETVNFLCDDLRIKAISFVGGDKAGKHIWDRAGANGKRVQANLGAKNHAILMPDANKDHALNAISGAAFGAAGQRCMALSVLVTVGESKSWVSELIERARVLKVGNGFHADVDLGPVISPEARQKIEGLIGSCETEGGKILLDGRGQKVDGYPEGNWVGPSVLEAEPGMSCYDTEIFGPVLTVVHADTIEEAIKLVNNNKYGNGASIFTTSGANARLFERTIEAGQLGVNVPIPVPLPAWSWSGNKGSVLGGHSLYGKLGIEFWTQNQTITALWRKDDATSTRSETSMPTLR